MLTNVSVKIPPPHFREKKRQRAQKPPFGNCKLDGTRYMVRCSEEKHGTLKLSVAVKFENEF